MTEEIFGSLRITNSKTLEKCKQNGEYDKLIKEGYIYAEGCGRFKKEVCTCSKCRKQKTERKSKMNEKLTLETFLYELFRAEDTYEANEKIVIKFLEQIRDEIGNDISYCHIEDVFNNYLSKK